MQAAVISDNDTFINEISDILRLYGIGEIVRIYRSAEEALNMSGNDNISCFFADSTASAGFGFIDQLHCIIKGSAVIFYAENGEQCFSAMDNGADHCITAPMTVNKVSHSAEIAELLTRRIQKSVNICTFGEFEVYVNGNILRFSNAKAKELLALCVDMRGESVSMEKAVSYLWEDRPYDENTKRLYRKAVIYLRDIFRQNNVNDFFETGRGFCRIEPEAVCCDYYDYMEQNGKGIYFGKYMSGYSWAEKTAGKLHFIQQEKNRNVPLDIIW